jgi:hypothetical protein
MMGENFRKWCIGLSSRRSARSWHASNMDSDMKKVLSRWKKAGIQLSAVMYTKGTSSFTGKMKIYYCHLFAWEIGRLGVIIRV